MTPSAAGLGHRKINGFDKPMRAVEIEDQFNRVHLAHLGRRSVDILALRRTRNLVFGRPLERIYFG
jgi:hypothetical protein